MNYIKYVDWIAENRALPDGTVVLLSGIEYAEHAEELRGMPVCVSPTGEAPEVLSEEPAEG